MGLIETNNGAEWTPLLMSLMKRRTQASYEAILSQLNEIWGVEVFSHINRIHTDYETAEINALIKIFGVSKVYGCIVHYIRATVHHIKSNLPNLFREFNLQKDVWKWIRRIFALPFLRKDEATKMWLSLVTFRNDFEGVLREEMDSFVSYMNNQWIKKIDQGNLFSFNKLTRTRSTNPVEAWHSVIKRDAASVRHASVSSVLNYFQKIFAESDERIVNLLAGAKPRQRDRTYEEIDNKILRLLTEYEEMIDKDEISDEEFSQTTQTYLNRLSYLLLQLDDKGISTRKDQKIKERKRKLRLEESVEKSKTRGQVLVDILNARAPKHTKNSEEQTVYKSLSSESTFSSQETHEVEHIGTMARAALRFLFNPLNEDQRQELCETWFYTFRQDHIEYAAPFDFMSSEYGPGEVTKIMGDGNCGWRGVALALTGTESNHVEIRRDVIEYLEETIYQHSHLNHSDNDWWSLFDSIENIREHIERAISPATGAHETDKWMKNLDIAAVSKMFRVNIIVCEQVKENVYRWQVYSPDLETSLSNLSQKKSSGSIFLYFHDEHFELIKHPQKIN